MDLLNTNDIQNSKMILLGEMLSNITHQWKEPLSTISSAATTLNLKNQFNILTQDENATLLKVILDKEKIEKDDEIYKYFKDNGIKVIIPKKKLHTKIAVFDDETMLIGSLNWTKESFEDNYEVLLISKNKKIINEMNIFIDSFN